MDAMLYERKDKNLKALEDDIAGALINRLGRENSSHTPDFILAGFLVDCLLAFERAVIRRTSWYDDDPMRNSHRQVRSESKQEGKDCPKENANVLSFPERLGVEGITIDQDVVNVVVSEWIWSGTSTGETSIRGVCEKAGRAVEGRLLTMLEVAFKEILCSGKKTICCGCRKDVVFELRTLQLQVATWVCPQCEWEVVLPRLDYASRELSVDGKVGSPKA